MKVFLLKTEWKTNFADNLNGTPSPGHRGTEDEKAVQEGYGLTASPCLHGGVAV